LHILATDFPLLKLAMENPLLIYVTDFPLLIDELFTISNGESVAEYINFFYLLK